WSKWPWETSSTSHRSTSAGDIGLDGLLNQGSNSTVLPPGVVSFQTECPYQVNVAFGFRPIGGRTSGVTVPRIGMPRTPRLHSIGACRTARGETRRATPARPDP